MKCQSSAVTRIGIVGAGRVGTALALALTRAGMEIAGVMSRSKASADRLIELAGLDSSVRCESSREVLERSNILFISVGDDSVAEVARQTADGLSPESETPSCGSAMSSSNTQTSSSDGEQPSSDSDTSSSGCERSLLDSDVSSPPDGARGSDASATEQTSRVAAHLSGALGSSVLSPLRKLGVSVASLHPVKSFSEDPRASADLAGTVATIEGDAPAVETLERLALALGMKTVRLESDRKPLYHAAACIASNYMVTLFSLSLALMESCGMEESIARAALSQLVRGTAQNLTDHPPGHALTGPIARGDVQTIRGHIEALRSLEGRGAESVYRVLGLQTVDLAERNGRVSPETASELRAALTEGRSTALQVQE